MTDTARSGDFVTVALRHALLTAEQAQALSQIVTQCGALPGDVALEEGLLDAVEVDIIAMLQNAQDAVPGYELLGVLGRGGMGVVFRARQNNLQREVALKTLLLSQLSQRDALARFQREAHTIAQLQHPNIVSVYDFDKHQGRLYLAMELIVGHDLGHHISRAKQLDERTTWLITRQIAVGLAYANRMGVVHRDIKPANILVVRDSESLAMASGAPLIKISDFGLSRLADEGSEARLTQTGRIVGTPNFMAPEQLTGELLDCRADIYALGGTVYNMLSGQPPYASQNLTQLMTRKLHEAPPDVRTYAKDVSEAGARLVAAMMHHDVNQRIGDYESLVEQIDQRLRALEPTRSEQTEQFFGAVQGSPPRSSWPTTGALTMIVLLVAAGLLGASGFLAWQRAQVPPPPLMVQGDWSAPLFNGESIVGWRAEPGASVAPERDFEGGRVLGLSGAAARSWTMPADVHNYRLTLAVALHEAKTVEVQFAPDGTGKPRYGLKLDPQAAQLIDYIRGASRVLATKALSPAQSDPTRYRYSLRIEQQQSHWWVFVDGEAVGSAPIQRLTEAYSLRISTTGGQALLEEIRVEELVARSQLTLH